MTPQRPHRVHVALLCISIGCSLVSLASLLLHPEGTGSLRTALNVGAVILVAVTATLLARGSGGGDR
jgi:hypothetical protein